jgi:hypothetical protein
MKNTTLLILLGIVSIGFACKKSDSNSSTTTGTTVTNTTYLTSSLGWVIKSASIYPAITFNGKTTTDYTPFLEKCALDNRTTFNIDGTSSFDKGKIKCDSNEVRYQKGTWRFINNETQIISKDSANAPNDTLTIVTLNSTNLITSYRGQNNGQVETLTITFTH